MRDQSAEDLARDSKSVKTSCQNLRLVQPSILELEMETTVSKSVVSIEDTAGFDMSPNGSERFGAVVAQIGSLLELEGLGCNYIYVEPGKRAFPFHSHLGNDEMFVILEGEGTYRIGKQEHPVRAGDVCGAPRGGPDTAHQLINTGKDRLRYLAISTRRDPEIVEYPDSNKFAALAIKPGPDFMNAHLRYIGRLESSLAYYDGEKL